MDQSIITSLIGMGYERKSVEAISADLRAGQHRDQALVGGGVALPDQQQLLGTRIINGHVGVQNVEAPRAVYQRMTLSGISSDELIVDIDG